MAREHGSKEVSDSFLMQAKTEVAILRTHCENDHPRYIKRPLKKLEELLGPENLYKVLMYSDLTVGKKASNQAVFKYANICYKKTTGETDDTHTHKPFSRETLEEIAKAVFITRSAKTPIPFEEKVLREKPGLKHNKRKNPPDPTLEKYPPLSPFPILPLPEAQPFTSAVPEIKGTGYPKITSLQEFHASRAEQQKVEQQIALVQELICCQQLIHANEQLANRLAGTFGTTPTPLTQAYSMHGLLQPPKTGASAVHKSPVPFYSDPLDLEPTVKWLGVSTCVSYP